MSIWDAPKKVKKGNQIEETSASTQSKATEDKRTSAKPPETSAQTSASNKNTGTDTTQTSERKSGASAKLLKELQSQLTLFNERLTALEQRPSQITPVAINEDIPRDLILSVVELAERIYHISIPSHQKNRKTGKVTDYYLKSGAMVGVCTKIRAWLKKPITYPWQKKPEA